VLGLVGAGLMLLGVYAFPYFKNLGTLASFLSGEQRVLLMQSVFPIVVLAVASVLALSLRGAEAWSAGALIGVGLVEASENVSEVIRLSAGLGLWLLLVGSVLAAVGGLLGIIQASKPQASTMP
jgi:hypothetical protein